MKESDGAEQPTTGHLRRARLGRITLWKSYALIRQEKTMIRGRNEKLEETKHGLFRDCFLGAPE